MTGQNKQSKEKFEFELKHSTNIDFGPDKPTRKGSPFVFYFNFEGPYQALFEKAHNKLSEYKEMMDKIENKSFIRYIALVLIVLYLVLCVFVLRNRLLPITTENTFFTTDGGILVAYLFIFVVVGFLGFVAVSLLWKAFPKKIPFYIRKNLALEPEFEKAIRQGYVDHYVEPLKKTLLRSFPDVERQLIYLKDRIKELEGKHEASENLAKEDIRFRLIIKKEIGVLETKVCIFEIVQKIIQKHSIHLHNLYQSVSEEMRLFRQMLEDGHKLTNEISAKEIVSDYEVEERLYIQPIMDLVDGIELEEVGLEKVILNIEMLYNLEKQQAQFQEDERNIEELGVEQAILTEIKEIQSKAKQLMSEN